jgi:oligopeptide transport system ATP-binding protein
MSSKPPLLSVSDLRLTFATRNGMLRAVRGVTFDVRRGETLGVVGESGSGKSVTFQSLMGLLPRPPLVVEGGSAVFDGLDLLGSPEADLRRIRGSRIAMIFQDPMTSLNPYMRIGEQIIEPLLIHGTTTRRDARTRAIALLERVGVTEPERRYAQYPHEFSGGMRQRAMIAMALIGKPDLLIADEPTTALDATVQAQILDLLRSLQRETGMAVVFITHDLGVVSDLCDRVQVMYAGRIVETGSVDQVLRAPLHPYTQALQKCIPALHPKGAALPALPGSPPDLSQPDAGCSFAPRCALATEACRTWTTTRYDAPGGRTHACLLARDNPGT